MIIYTKVNSEIVAETTVLPTEDLHIMQIHQVVFKWNRDVYYEMLLDFEDLKEVLKAKNIIKIRTGSFDVQCKKLPRYWKMMGFVNPRIIEHNTQSYLFAEMEI